MSSKPQKLWTYPEQRRLAALYNEGHPLSEIATILDRPLASVEVKSCRLGLSSRNVAKCRRGSSPAVGQLGRHEVFP